MINWKTRFDWKTNTGNHNPVIEVDGTRTKINSFVVKEGILPVAGEVGKCAWKILCDQKNWKEHLDETQKNIFEKLNLTLEIKI